MGVVYEAEQDSLGRRVALKVLPPHALTNPKQVRRFEREAQAAARLHHTNIVPVFGVGSEDGHPLLRHAVHPGPAAERGPGRAAAAPPGAGCGRGARHGEGRAADPTAPPTAADVARSLWTGGFAPAVGDPGSTDALLADRREQPKAEPPRRAAGGRGRPQARLQRPGPARSAAGALGMAVLAERGPDRRAGGRGPGLRPRAGRPAPRHQAVQPAARLRGTVWVTDFGLAKAADHEDLTHTGDILGTLRYMAPERFEGQADARSDVYALGLTLYELLALRPAFEETDRPRLIKQVTQAEPPRLRKLDPAMPRDLETIVHKAIARDPADRYPTAGELADDLKRFLDDRPIRARRLSPARRGLAVGRRNKAVASLLGLVAALMVAFSAGSMIAAGALPRLP